MNRLLVSPPLSPLVTNSLDIVANLYLFTYMTSRAVFVSVQGIALVFTVLHHGFDPQSSISMCFLRGLAFFTHAARHNLEVPHDAGPKPILYNQATEPHLLDCFGLVWV